MPNKEETTPWKPASLLNVSNKVAGRRYRWIRKADLERKLLEGWQIVDKNSGASGPAPTLADGKGLDSTIQKRELILCWMPEEMAKSRNKYFDSKADDIENAAVDELRESAKETGAETYGELKILSAKK